MREILRSNDWVRLSFIQALLRDAGIEGVVLDQHTSVLEGSIGAIPRRLMVAEEDDAAARRIVAQSELSVWQGHPDLELLEPDVAAPGARPEP